MPIIQVAYEVPADIYLGLMTGSLTRFGSVVRNHVGITKHLKEINMPDSNSSANKLVLAKVLEKAKTLKNPKVIAIGSVVALVTGGLVFAGIKLSKNKKSAEQNLPKCVSDFNNALCVYLEAVRNGNLELVTITDLISRLNEIKDNYDGGKIQLDFSTGQLNTLFNLIFDYTKKLAEANSFELNSIDETEPTSSDRTIVSLKRYLEVQKQIFEKAS